MEAAPKLKKAVFQIRKGRRRTGNGTLKLCSLKLAGVNLAGVNVKIAGTCVNISDRVCPSTISLIINIRGT